MDTGKHRHNHGRETRHHKSGGSALSRRSHRSAPDSELRPRPSTPIPCMHPTGERASRLRILRRVYSSEVHQHNRTIHTARSFSRTEYTPLQRHHRCSTGKDRPTWSLLLLPLLVMLFPPTYVGASEHRACFCPLHTPCVLLPTPQSRNSSSERRLLLSWAKAGKLLRLRCSWLILQLNEIYPRSLCGKKPRPRPPS